MKGRRLFFLFISFLFCLSTVPLLAQRTILVEGTVKDSVTNEPVSYVAVSVKGTTYGTTTDEAGYFKFSAPERGDSLMLTCLGYHPLVFKINLSQKRNFALRMVPTSYQLSETVVKPGKEKYSRKDNPAVTFVKKIIDSRDKNDPRNQPYYSYEQYADLTVALNEFTDARKGSWSYKRFGSLADFADTSSISGKPILPISQKETLEEVYYSKSPHRERRVVVGQKSAGVDEILTEEGVKQFLGEIFKEVNVFQNDVPLLLQRFVSPLSSIGPYFYKYYLMDTVMVAGEECINLGFVPFVSEGFGFTGNLYFTNDSVNFLKRLVLNVPKDINLNFVDRMTIMQEFERGKDNIRLMTKDDILVEFKITSNSKGLYARRTSEYRKHSFDPPENMAVFDESAPVIELVDARSKPESFWVENRAEGVEVKENSVDKLMTRLRSVPFYYWTEKVISILVSGYIQTSEEGGAFEIGPMNTIVSGNSFEGVRFRVGGTTTTKFSPRLFLDGYVAYGTTDQKLKYDAIVEYSFIDKKQFRKEFPVHSIRAEYSYDVNQLGQQYLYTNADNLFLALKRKENDLMTYKRKAELSYKREHYNGWSYAATLRHQTETATEYSIPFNEIQADGSVRQVLDYTSSELEFMVRWAPNEKFYQTRNYRYPITFDAPVITLNHVIGGKGILGSDYNFNRTDISVGKRFWLSAFGYIDFIAKGGKVWDKVPFPMLIIPNANLSYTIQPESYSLLNPMEFIHDQYVSWDLTYYMNGALFNRIPLLKELKWREVFTFKGFYGDLSNKNDPAKGHAGLFVFPESTYEMGNKPYMEIGFGITNIFKVIRLDYIWRLSYRDHQEWDAANSGLRFRFDFSF